MTTQVRAKISRSVNATYATGEPQKKISEAIKKAHKEHPEILEKIRNRSSGSKWLWKLDDKGNEIRTFARPEDLEKLQANGWHLGMSPHQEQCLAAVRGKPHTEETKAKISKALKGKPKIADHAKHIREAQRGIKRTQEFCKHVSDATRKAMQTPEIRQKCRDNVIGRRKVNNGIQVRFVRGEELERLLLAGWQYGNIKHENKKN